MERAGRFLRDDRVERDRALAAARARVLDEMVPTTLDRFTIGGVLGRGAFGRVYAAYDPRLQREVALKVMHREARPSSLDLGDEARKLARLRHPNLVVAHELIEVGDEWILVMEKIDGKTLREWLRGKPSTRAIVRAFEGLAAGLQALGDAGLVHRDVKPSNIVVDDDGLARLVDFGLALEAGAADAPRAGTPAFMAPEQQRGEAVDARADQYALCATFWEAFTGSLPWPVGDPDAMLAAKDAGVVGRGHPRFVFAVLRRGLEPNPTRRYASMTVLRHDLRRRRTRSRLAARGIPVALGLVGLVATWEIDRRLDAAECHRAAAEVGRSWNADVRERFLAALGAANSTYGGALGATAAERIDRFVDAWAAASADACAQQQAGHDMRAQRACLTGQLERLDVLIASTDSIDGHAVFNVPSVLTSFGSPSRCLEPEPEVPQDLFAEADLEAFIGFRSALGEVEVGCDLAPVPACLHGLDAIEADPPALPRCSWEPDLLVVRAESFELLARHDEAIEAARLAARTAEGCRRDRPEFQGRSLLIEMLAAKPAGDPELEFWIESTRAALARMGDDPMRNAGFHLSLGNAATHRQDFARARDEYAQSLAIYEEHLQPDDPKLASAYEGYASAQGMLGHRAEARALLQRVLQLREVEYGADHPRLAQALSNLAVFEDAPDVAASLLRRSLAIYGEHAPRSRGAGSAWFNLGLALEQLGDDAEAQRAFEQALAIFTDVDGPRSATGAYVAAALAGIRRERLDLDGAARALDQAVATAESTLPPDHPWARFVATQRAALLRTQGRTDEAIAIACAEIETAFDVIEAGDPDLPFAIATCIDALVERGRGSEVSPTLRERASTIACTPRNQRRCTALQRALARL